MSVGRKLGFILGLGLLVSTAAATDVAILRNGFSIRHERRSILGSDTRLYLSDDASSYVDVPTAEIDHIEHNVASDPEPAPPAPTPAVAGIPARLVGPVSAPAPARRVTDPVSVENAVHSASDRYRLDPDLVNSVIRVESNFNPRAVSPKGAQGLMQLMPQTASKLGVPNSFDPQANIDGGTRYLRALLERYNFDLRKALAAYNAGPQRVEQYGGVPPYPETREYITRIVKDFNKKKLAQQKVLAQGPRTQVPSKAQTTPQVRTSPSTTASATANIAATASR
jgi:hypothetical protein